MGSVASELGKCGATRYNWWEMHDLEQLEEAEEEEETGEMVWWSKCGGWSGFNKGKGKGESGGEEDEAVAATRELYRMSPVFAQVVCLARLELKARQGLVTVGRRSGVDALAEIVPAPQLTKVSRRHQIQTSALLSGQTCRLSHNI